MGFFEDDNASDRDNLNTSSEDEFTRTPVDYRNYEDRLALCKQIEMALLK